MVNIKKEFSKMNLHGKDIKIFTANSNPDVAAEIAKQLNLPLGAAEVKTFSDGEISVSKMCIRDRRGPVRRTGI